MIYVCAFFSFLALVQASIGDSSSHFQICLQDCKRRDCANQSLFETKQPFYLRFMGWNCREECKYQCMWPTIKVFQENDIDVPKFYGKWPFIRVLGTQELVSSVASLFNMIPHIVKLRQFRIRFTKFYPMYYEWQSIAVPSRLLFTIYCQVNINAWFWSFLFHAKETIFTERLDYICAFILILFNAYICSVRMSLGKTYIPIVVGTALSILFVHHLHYMLFVLFDYGYNMKVNIAVGVTTIGIWILWFVKVRRKQPYAIKVFISCVVTLLLMSLEVLDFPPIFWLFDAHSLWHLSTPPLIFLWYRFIIEDLEYLKRLEQEEHIA